MSIYFISIVHSVLTIKRAPWFKYLPWQKVNTNHILAHCLSKITRTLLCLSHLYIFANFSQPFFKSVLPFLLTVFVSKITYREWKYSANLCQVKFQNKRCSTSLVNLVPFNSSHGIAPQINRFLTRLGSCFNWGNFWQKQVIFKLLFGKTSNTSFRINTCYYVLYLFPELSAIFPNYQNRLWAPGMQFNWYDLYISFSQKISNTANGDGGLQPPRFFQIAIFGQTN